MSFWGGRRNVLARGLSLVPEEVLSSRFSVLSRDLDADWELRTGKLVAPS